MGAVHALRLGHVPKEPLIAAFFSMAVAMPVISSVPSSPDLVPAVAMFALLCWLNCAAIAAWESPWSGYLDPVTRMLGRRFGIFAGIAVLLSLALMFAQATRGVGFAAVTGSVLLLALERLRGRVSRTHVRALADAALLSPLVVLPLLLWTGR